MNRSNNLSTFHALLLAAKEKGYTEFQLQLTDSGGRLEFCIRPQGRSETSARFEVRGNTVRPAAGVVMTAGASDNIKEINHGGTRSGEIPVWAL